MPGSHSKKDKLKKKVAKVRKADQQDINRVKRWNSRSFNKKKELSGPTEPVFKTTATIKPLTTRPHPGMVGDELVANLRNRLAKIENYNAEADPEASAGEWINKYRKKRKNGKKENKFHKKGSFFWLSPPATSSPTSLFARASACFSGWVLQWFQPPRSIYFTWLATIS
mgnify:CR=1 FL=1